MTADDARRLATSVVLNYRGPRMMPGDPEVTIEDGQVTCRVTYQPALGMTDEQTEMLTALFASRMTGRSLGMDALAALFGECCQELGL